jgi:hypothetical protein
MEKLPIQISFMDISTSTPHALDTWDNIIGAGDNMKLLTLPIPHKGDIINIAKFGGEDNSLHYDYKVTEVKYAYKHFYEPEQIMTYVTVYVKKV